MSKDHNSYFGSQRNFVTTNLYDFTRGILSNPIPNPLTSPNPNSPMIKGPDNVYSISPDHTSMNPSTAKFFIKKDPTTGFDMQRITFQQEADGYKIKVSITQRFTQHGKVEIQTNFTNVGKKNIKNFAGFTFRDITFMKNSNYDKRQSKTHMLSLGNNEGMYASRDEEDGRIEFNLNGYEDSPYAWSGRGTKSSFFISEGPKDFPWQKGAMGGMDNAFSDINDQGDKTKIIPAGKSWLPTSTLDENGISMHTKKQSLGTNKSVSMTYSTKLVEKTDNIELRMYNEETHVLSERDNESYLISGNWHHYKDSKIHINYMIDPPNETPEYLKNHGISISKSPLTQNSNQQAAGELQDWKVYVKNLKQLKQGTHKIVFVAYDDRGNFSEVKDVKLIQPNKKISEPQINLDKSAEGNNPSNPLETSANEISLEGTWELGDSDTATIYYRLDDNKRNLVLQKINKGDGDIGRFHLLKYDIQNLNKAVNHRITFIIDDHIHPPVSDIFYFKHKDGGIVVDAPKFIEFGKHHLIPGQNKTISPSVSRKVSVSDYRSVNASNATLKLIVGKFSSDDGKEINHSVDWKKASVKDNTPITVLSRIRPNKNEWVTTKTINDLDQAIKMKLNSNENTPGTGNYKSKWTWELDDTL